MHADGITCCSSIVVTVGLGSLVKNRGKKGGNIHLPPLSYDRNPIASTRGFEIGNLPVDWETGEFEAIELKTTTRHNGAWEWVPPCLWKYRNYCSVVRSDHNLQLGAL